MARGISEGASKKNLVAFLFGDVLSHSFFFVENIIRFVQGVVQGSIHERARRQYTYLSNGKLLAGKFLSARYLAELWSG